MGRSEAAIITLEEARGRLIGIGAAVTRRLLPHHRTYGSVYGGSRSYANNPQITKGDRAI
jgi:hypothetical protein